MTEQDKYQIVLRYAKLHYNLNKRNLPHVSKDDIVSIFYRDCIHIYDPLGKSSFETFARTMIDCRVKNLIRSNKIRQDHNPLFYEHQCNLGDSVEVEMETESRKESYSVRCTLPDIYNDELKLDDLPKINPEHELYHPIHKAKRECNWSRLATLIKMYLRDSGNGSSIKEIDFDIVIAGAKRINKS